MHLFPTALGSLITQQITLMATTYLSWYTRLGFSNRDLYAL